MASLRIIRAYKRCGKVKGEPSCTHLGGSGIKERVMMYTYRLSVMKRGTFDKSEL